MATRDVVTLNESTSSLEVAQTGDSYNMPQKLAVPQVDVGGNTASAAGRVAVSGVEFPDGSVALTGAGVAGAATLNDVLGNGNSSNKEIVLGGKITNPAIAASLPNLAFVDVASFDNSKNPAWLDKCEDKSWYNETTYAGTQFVQTRYANDAAALAANPAIVANDIYYNSTSGAFVLYSTGITIYRAGSQKFPMRGYVTAEARRVIIWDTTDGSPTMWMVFNARSIAWATYATWISLNTITSVAVKNNILVVGDAAIGIVIIDLVAESQINRRPDVGPLTHKVHGIANRNDTSGQYTRSGGTIVNASVNDVALTHLPDAPIDSATGMRVPTVGAATAGGVSVITQDGNVWDITPFNGAYTNTSQVTFTKEHKIWFTRGY